MLRVALMVVLSITRRAGIIFTTSLILLIRTHFRQNQSRDYFRRCAMFLSVRRLCRVFAPNVGKPHGVWG